jgi:glyoxylase-like metal-dependent hydrolase (beta-lactamase superfamily II)
MAQQPVTAHTQRRDRPEVGGAVEVARGVLWLRMPLPYALDHVNLYLLDDGAGWTLVDAGHGDDATRRAWEVLDANVLGGKPITRVICTHHHPDHFGLAGWLVRRWGAELWCTRAEWQATRTKTLRSSDETRALWRRFYLRAGVPPAQLQPVMDCSRSYPDHISSVPASFHRVQAGDELTVGGRRWRAIVGRGHAREHLCLHAPEDGLFLAGDQVLQHITPNVSLWPDDPDDDPLADYVASLRALRTIPAETLALPSHGHPFTGLARRCAALEAHHEERLDAVVTALARPATAFEVMRSLFRPGLDAHQATFAIGESIAHLNRLASLGLVERTRAPGQPDSYERVGR